MLRRLVQLIEAIAFDVEFPAVIDAAQAAFLVAPEIQRDAAVRTEFVEQPDAAVAVAEGDEVLAEQADADRRAVGLGDLPRQTGGDPIPPHRIAHRGAGADAGDQFVFLRWQHSLSPRKVFSAGPASASLSGLAELYLKNYGCGGINSNAAAAAFDDGPGRRDRSPRHGLAGDDCRLMFAECSLHQSA